MSVAHPRGPLSEAMKILIRKYNSSVLSPASNSDAAPLATTSGRDLGTEPTLARGVGTDSLPSEGDTRPRPNSDPCQTSGRSPGRGDVRPDGGEASAREDVPVAARSPGIKRSQSFREDVKEKEKWRTIRERIQSGPKHWHRLHAPSAVSARAHVRMAAFLRSYLSVTTEWLVLARETVFRLERLVQNPYRPIKSISGRQCN